MVWDPRSAPWTKAGTANRHSRSFLVPATGSSSRTPSITLDYGDKGWRTPLRMETGAVYLPIQHTQLDVTRPIVTRRHFFQWFGWIPHPAGNPSSWSLQWMLSEVVGDQLLYSASETSLVVVNGPTRPAAYDVTSLVRLRVNANGEAEFTIVAGSSSRTEVIQSKPYR